MDIQFGYWMPLGSGGMVISSLPQRTDWTLEWNAQMAATAESVGYDYGLAPARFIASHGWEFQQEPTIWDCRRQPDVRQHLDRAGVADRARRPRRA